MKKQSAKLFALILFISIQTRVYSQVSRLDNISLLSSPSDFLGWDGSSLRTLEIRNDAAAETYQLNYEVSGEKYNQFFTSLSYSKRSL